MLPHLEHMHWGQVAADYEDLAIKDAFEEITLGFMEDALKRPEGPPRQPREWHRPLSATRAARLMNRTGRNQFARRTKGFSSSADAS